MAFYSDRCVSCNSISKHQVEETLNDGEKYQFIMYECDEKYCEVNQKRRQGERELHRLMYDEGENKHEENNNNRTRAGKRRQNDRKNGGE